MTKKIYILAAVALFAACANNDVKNDIVDNNEIGFDANTYKTTRAEISDNAALATAGGFIVWGYKAKNQATMDWTVEAHTVFDGVNVTAAANSGAYISGNQTNWTYSSKKYWDKNAKYCFYAAAPYKASTYSVTGTNDAKMIIINGATSGLASASDDFLVARGGVKDRAGSDQTSNVDFTFNHVMTKVDFLLKKASTVTGEVKVQSITMTGWDNGVGKFTQRSNSTPASLDNSEWEFTSNVAGSVSILTGETAALTTTGAKTTSQDYIMVPQDITAGTLTFTINYTVDGEPFLGHIGSIANAQKWGTDSHFTYTLTISPAAIEFDVVQINGFQNPTTDGVTVQ